jgi:putative phage-type endonuclease
MDRAEWLEARRTGIGGSDAAKVMGLSPWGGPLSVFMDKTGRAPEKEESEAMEMGTELEETVARVFVKRTGIEVETAPEMYRHPEYPWMLANVDRLVVGENKGLECKTAHFMKGKQWEGDDLPDEYYAQCQHYICVMGWESCWIAALIGGQRFCYKEVPRNEEFIEAMVGAEREFWHEYVCKDIQPKAAWCDDVASMYPAAGPDESMLAPTAESMTLALELKRLKAESKEIERAIDGRENRLRQIIGNYAGIEGVATYKNNKDSVKVDWEAAAYAMGATNEVISRYSVTKPGARVLRLLKTNTDAQCAPLQQ